MTNRPTRADVAREAGVSAATVSYVLNDARDQTISATTRDAVRDAAERLGYRPNLAARNLATGRSGVVLHLIPRAALGDLSVQIASRLSRALAQRGIVMAIQFDSDDAQTVLDALDYLHPIAVSGLLPPAEPVAAAITAAGIPSLHLHSEGAGRLGGMHRAVGEAQVAHLTASGHTRVAFARSDVTALARLGDLRLEAVQVACEARGLAPPLTSILATDGTDAGAVVSRWASAGVTAVCAYNDDTAAIVLHGIRRAGLRCPDDLAVVGVDDSPICWVTEPPLSSVGFDVEGVVESAVAGVLQALGHPVDHVTSDAGPVVHLTERTSTSSRRTGDR